MVDLSCATAHSCWHSDVVSPCLSKGPSKPSFQGHFFQAGLLRSCTASLNLPNEVLRRKWMIFAVVQSWDSGTLAKQQGGYPKTYWTLGVQSQLLQNHANHMHVSFLQLPISYLLECLSSGERTIRWPVMTPSLHTSETSAERNLVEWGSRHMEFWPGRPHEKPPSKCISRQLDIVCNTVVLKMAKHASRWQTLYQTHECPWTLLISRERGTASQLLSPYQGSTWFFIFRATSTVR